MPNPEEQGDAVMKNVCIARSRGRFFPGCFSLAILIPAVAFSALLVWVSASAATTVAVDRIGGFKSPTRLAVAASGAVYVSDHKNGKVVIIDGSGARIGAIEGFGAPLGLAVRETPPSLVCRKFKEKNGKCKDGVLQAGQTFVYVGDDETGSIRVFIDGEYWTGDLAAPVDAAAVNCQRRDIHNLQPPVPDQV